MNKKLGSIVSFLLIVALVWGSSLSPSLAAADTSALQKQVNQLQQQLNALGEEQKEAGEYQAILGQQIDALNAQLEVYQDQVDALNAQETELLTQICRLDEEISSKQTAIDGMVQELKGLLRVNYMSGMSWLEALLNATDFSTLLANLEYSKRASSRSNELKEEVDKQIAEMELVRTDEQSKYDELENTKAQVSAVQNDMQNTVNDLNGKLAASRDLSKQISEKYSQAKDERDRAAQELAQAQAEADRDLDPYNPDQPVNPSGFICPLPRGSFRVTQPFGGAHTGVDLAAPSGTPIYASKSGVVVTLQHWDGHSTGGMQSYGNMVQISHGDGTSTLYAHCNALFVQKGEQVSQGQKIATVGTTGNSSGNHLHFEMKIGGVRVDPLKHIG